MVGDVFSHSLIEANFNHKVVNHVSAQLDPYNAAPDAIKENLALIGS